MGGREVGKMGGWEVGKLGRLALFALLNIKKSTGCEDRGCRGRFHICPVMGRWG
jgi:hypothetical protein